MLTNSCAVCFIPRGIWPCSYLHQSLNTVHLTNVTGTLFMFRESKARGVCKWICEQKQSRCKVKSGSQNLCCSKKLSQGTEVPLMFGEHTGSMSTLLSAEVNKMVLEVATYLSSHSRTPAFPKISFCKIQSRFLFLYYQFHPQEKYCCG